MSYWLMKSEPDVFGIDRLQREQTTLWDGVRNYQARNFLKSMLLSLQHQSAGNCGLDGDYRIDGGRS
jgi:predicted RNA-binding protein with PUA-like domain